MNSSFDPASCRGWKKLDSTRNGEKIRLLNMIRIFFCMKNITCYGPETKSPGFGRLPGDPPEGFSQGSLGWTTSNIQRGNGRLVSVLEGGYNTRGEVPIHGMFCGVSDIKQGPIKAGTQREREIMGWWWKQDRDLGAIPGNTDWNTCRSFFRHHRMNNGSR